MTVAVLPNATNPTLVVINSEAATTGVDITLCTPPSGRRIQVLSWQVFVGGAAPQVAGPALKLGTTIFAPGLCVFGVGVGQFMVNAFESPAGYPGYEGAVDEVLKLSALVTGHSASGHVLIRVY